VPLSGKACGLPGASSVIVTVAERLPVALGVKVAEIVQVALAASSDGTSGQLFVCAKSAEFVPPSRIELIASGAVPLLRTVTVCAALVVPTTCDAKETLVGVSVTAGWVPVPLSETECGLPAALSVTVTAAVRLPGAEGVKVTEIVQDAPAPSEAGHVFVCA
jgi:hypothetical protein